MHTRLFSQFSGLLLCAGLFSGCSSPGQLGSRVSDNALRFAAGSPDPSQPIRLAMTFATTFDHGPDADFAMGDAKLYSATAPGNQAQGMPGLPASSTVKRVADAGVHGGALEFTQKSGAMVFYQGNTNLAYRTNWSGTVSFWLKPSGDKDSAASSSQPLQIAGQKLADGSVGVAFGQDKAGNFFSYAVKGQQSLWNPENLPWEGIPKLERPVVQVTEPPFAADRWTHVVITFKYANTGRNDGIGKLYLDGQFYGSLAGFNNTLMCDPVQNYLNLGQSYVGLLDEVSVFNRDLSAKEVQVLHHLPHGLLDLLYRTSACPLIGERKWLTKDNHFK